MLQKFFSGLVFGAGFFVAVALLGWLASSLLLLVGLLDDALELRPWLKLAGQVIVADGTPEAAARIERVLTTDPGMGVIRHVDAGYEEAIEFAEKNGVVVPMKQGE